MPVPLITAWGGHLPDPTRWWQDFPLLQKALSVYKTSIYCTNPEAYCTNPEAMERLPYCPSLACIIFKDGYAETFWQGRWSSSAFQHSELWLLVERLMWSSAIDGKERQMAQNHELYLLLLSHHCLLWLCTEWFDIWIASHDVVDLWQESGFVLPAFQLEHS